MSKTVNVLEGTEGYGTGKDVSGDEEEVDTEETRGSGDVYGTTNLRETSTVPGTLLGQESGLGGRGGSHTGLNPLSMWIIFQDRAQNVRPQISMTC